MPNKWTNPKSLQHRWSHWSYLGPPEPRSIAAFEEVTKWAWENGLYISCCFQVNVFLLRKGDRLPGWTGNTQPNCLDFREHGDGRNEGLVMLWFLVFVGDLQKPRKFLVPSWNTYCEERAMQGMQSLFFSHWHIWICEQLWACICKLIRPLAERLWAAGYLQATRITEASLVVWEHWGKCQAEPCVKSERCKTGVFVVVYLRKNERK